MTARRARWIGVAAAAMLGAVLVPGAGAMTTATLKVPATADIFGAGRSAVPPGSGGTGTLPPGFGLPAGNDRVLTFFAVAGKVTCCKNQRPVVNNGPEGRPDFSTSLSGTGGISGVEYPRAMFLAGVFLGPGTPSARPPAKTATVTPALGQVFYIGNGQGAGGPVRFKVPAGATRLFLGVADGYSFRGAPGYYSDNAGEFIASFTVTSGTPAATTTTTTSTAASGWDVSGRWTSFVGDLQLTQASGGSLTGTFQMKIGCTEAYTVTGRIAGSAIALALVRAGGAGNQPPCAGTQTLNGSVGPGGTTLLLALVNFASSSPPGPFSGKARKITGG